MRIPIPNEKYKHFKGGIYTIICVAEHSESKEQLVIYQRADDGSEYAEKICARPLEMFMSKVDKAKYPEVEQEQRFELISTCFGCEYKWRNDVRAWMTCKECRNFSQYTKEREKKQNNE